MSRPLMGTLAAVVILGSAACGLVSESASSGPSGAPTPTLTRTGRLLEPGLFVKGAGSVLAILDQSRAKIRVDSLNQGAQTVLNDAVIVLRSSPQTTVFVWASVGQAIPGTSATSMADLKVGEHVTFGSMRRPKILATVHIWPALSVGRAQAVSRASDQIGTKYVSHASSTSSGVSSAGFSKNRDAAPRCCMRSRGWHDRSGMFRSRA